MAEDREHKGPKHHASKSHPRKPERHGAKRRGLHHHVGGTGRGVIPTYGMGFYTGSLGQVTSTGTNPPISGPAPMGDPGGQSGHLSPDQFVGYPGGFSTDAGNMTGVAAIEGAAGNGGAGGSGDVGASGGSPS